MSIHGFRAASRTGTISPISLVDTTRREQESQQDVQDPASSSSPTTLTKTTSGAPLSRRFTRDTLKEGLARRKYAKYQQGRDGVDVGELNEDAGDEAATESGAESSIKAPAPARGRERLRDRVSRKSKKPAVQVSTKEETAIDILYENQRGSFLCGIPLYSANALWNFDPSEWQTSNFQDSAVNITNAQVPDPSWAWAWRTWYVDMSHDVDEQGWEYSFHFGSKFAWHGNHPWFHSFVRRRRWLRKRMKIKPHEASRRRSTRAAHQLNADYFTIHAANRERSRGSSAERTPRSSYIGGHKEESDSDEEFEDINNTTILMAALKKAKVDREKIAAVKKFLEQGGDELHYLQNVMPEIMALFIYPTSRQQLQTILVKSLQSTMTQPQPTDEDAAETDETRQRKIQDLFKAIQATGLEASETNNPKALKDLARVTDGSAGKQASDDDSFPGPPNSDNEDGIEDEIKGIPKDAEVSKEPGVFNLGEDEGNVEKPSLDNGKGKEKE